jgi:hypothetical protein
MKQFVSIIIVAIIAVSFPSTINAAPKKKAGAETVAAGVKQPKKAIYQKRQQTICGPAAKMSGGC